MSKKDKLLGKLLAVPAPKDFTWEELVTVMTRSKFDNRCRGGSHYIFEHESGFRLFMSKTHPGGILKGYQVKAAIDALKQIGAIRGEE